MDCRSITEIHGAQEHLIISQLCMMYLYIYYYKSIKQHQIIKHFDTFYAKITNVFHANYYNFFSNNSVFKQYA